MRIDSDPTRRTTARDDSTGPARAAPTRDAPSLQAYSPSPAAEAQGQRLLLAFVASSASPTPKPNDDTLYVGMSAMAPTELAGLKQTARGHVVGIVGSASSTIAAADGSGRTFDASDPDEVARFVDTLGLPAERAREVSAAINASELRARDELAKIAQVWSKAELGGSVPSRLALSGHGAYADVHGEDTGRIYFDVLGKLAKAMPRAAAQVEDVFVAACFQGEPEKLQKFVEMFPNLKSANGYRDFAPEADVAGLRRWEVASRGRAEPRIALKEGGSWTKSGSYSGEVSLPIARREVARLDVFDAYFRGSAADPSAHKGPLTTYYTALQHLAGARDLPPNEQPAMETRVFQVCCLRFFDVTRAKFATDHRAALDAGCRELGMTSPALEKMSRAEAMAAIASLETRAQASPGTAATSELLRLIRGLRDLDPAIVRFS